MAAPLLRPLAAERAPRHILAKARTRGQPVRPWLPGPGTAQNVASSWKKPGGPDLQRPRPPGDRGSSPFHVAAGRVPAPDWASSPPSATSTALIPSTDPQNSSSPHFSTPSHLTALARSLQHTGGPCPPPRSPTQSASRLWSLEAPVRA